MIAQCTQVLRCAHTPAQVTRFAHYSGRPDSPGRFAGSLLFPDIQLPVSAGLGFAGNERGRLRLQVLVLKAGNNVVKRNNGWIDLLMAAGLVAVTVLAGCSAARSSNGPIVGPRPDLIFYPAYAQLEPIEPIRPEWPTVAAQDRPEDVIYFQETINDRGSHWSFNGQDRYQRRFDSVRVGVARP
jgi:hypothetical protein